MKPTLTHMSRFDMKQALKNNQLPDDTLIISINDTANELNEIVDLVSGKYLVSGYCFKDDENSFACVDAEDILTEVRVSQVKNIVVHCFAGVSRSAAVAKWINDYLELDIEKYNNYTQHNKYVYDMLCMVSGVANINNYYREMENEYGK